MKLIQYKDAQGINVFLYAHTIQSYISVDHHRTEVECTNGAKHVLHVNTQALIARLHKDDKFEIIETAPDRERH
jgi:hypothetical protein